MFERYTEKARRVIFFARYEASQLGSQHIETEHLLLGLMRECRGLVDADAEGIRKAIEAHGSRGPKISTTVDLPLSHDSKEALFQAAQEADRLGHRHIAAAHLLAGLFAVTGGLAHALLAERGVTIEAIRAKAEETPAETSFVEDFSQTHALAGVAVLAVAEARRMNQQPQLLHVLLALLADQDGPAGRLLREYGLTRELVLARLEQ